jgi:phage shock protein A
MAETIGSRVGRILSGGLSALISAVENAAPETVMAEAVAEIDRAIEDVRVELGRTLGSKHLASTRLMEENARHTDLTEKIALAVKEGREDLAEAAVGQQLDIEAQLPVLESAMTDNEAREQELEGLIAALQAKKRQMRDELAQYRDAQVEATQIQTSGSGASSGSGGVDRKVSQAESAFERVFEMAGKVPAGSGDTKTQGQLAELEELARKNRIQERLAAVKADQES